jgi:hypothetical protein
VGAETHPPPSLRVVSPPFLPNFGASATRQGARNGRFPVACRWRRTPLYLAAPPRPRREASALRLAVQDAALSRRKHGFDSRRARQPHFTCNLSGRGNCPGRRLKERAAADPEGGRSRKSSRRPSRSPKSPSPEPCSGNCPLCSISRTQRMCVHWQPRSFMSLMHPTYSRKTRSRSFTLRRFWHVASTVPIEPSLN